MHDPGPRRHSSPRSTAAFRVFTVAGLLIGLAVPTARADIFLDEAERIRIFGDFRFRLESDWDSRAPDGTERADRDRARIRVRLGFQWDPTKHVAFGIRGRTGNTDGQQSPHVTVIQAGDNGDGDVLVDRAWVQIKGGPGWLWLGRNGSPFWSQNEHLFDDDIWFDGLGFGFDWKSGKNEHLLRGAYAAVPEGDASLDWEDQGFLAGLQYAYSRELANGNVTTALGGYAVDDEETVTNPVLLDQDYLIWMLSVQRAFKAGDLPIKLGIDLLHDADAPGPLVHDRGERDGLVASAQFGSLQEKGDWLAGYWYAHVEKYALVPFLAQDDWLRWGSATQTRSSNYRGHEVRFAYAFRSNMNIVARLYLVDGIEFESPTALAKEDGKRFRIDFNWRF